MREEGIRCERRESAARRRDQCARGGNQPCARGGNQLAKEGITLKRARGFFTRQPGFIHEPS